ncbi:MAG: quinone-interacting membrane-bound oxidoreductase complex subunit QmoC [Desulfobulbaceae bacterium]|jgi:quinone-modifying oxidoreductase subunit QmoC|nr:quinone-interacting membrane-bound oxidoreductase complex subunit QmoC [Desulfobulbaceae bacterium]
MNVQPDLEFIRELKTAGGDTLKKCFQCATCSVACPLSTESKPFPRKEMIWASWGLKDQLVTDPDVFLCHQCGDCTEKCPRGAKPGETLGAIRAYAYQQFAWPKGLAKLTTSQKNLPILIGLPAVVILVMWILSALVPGTSGLHIPSVEAFAEHGYQQFFGDWSVMFKWYGKNIFFIALIMGVSALIAIISCWMGVTRMWKAMIANAEIVANYRPSLCQFVGRFLWPSLLETLQHKRFKECKTNSDRVSGHLPLVLAFIGLFLATCWSLIKNDILGLIWPSLHGPLAFFDPIKLIANVSAIAMLYGVWILWKNRRKMEAEGRASNTFYDWFLIWEIAAVGVTGLLAELLRWGGQPLLGYFVYYLHLVTVMMLFLYMPYTKFAHIVYRTVAMCFEKYRTSSFVR